ncbi:MAG: hypothetical protein NVSMB14_05820 [Isosphaeraceae bacterium]
MTKAHGRREKRTLLSTTWINEYLDWPDVKQVFILRRERTIGGKTTVEEIAGITSLTREQASAAKLLHWIRRHWAIENQLFGVRDTTFGEDACRVRKGSAAEVMASLRNAILHLVGRLSFPGKAAAARYFLVHPLEAGKILKSPT